MTVPRSTYKTTVSKTVSGRDPRAATTVVADDDEVLAPVTGEGQDDEINEGEAEEEVPAEDSQEVYEAEGPEVISEEVEDLKFQCSPCMPSQAEVEEHRITHNPYRSWCQECVMGRGVGGHRGRHTGRPHEIPRVGIDYWFWTGKAFKKRQELEYPETELGRAELEKDRKSGILTKCIVIRCHETKAVMAHVVPCKGLDEDRYVVDIVCSDIAWLGHVKLILNVTMKTRCCCSYVKRCRP